MNRAHEGQPAEPRARRLPTWARSLPCPKCAAALGLLSEDGNVLKVSDSVALYYRARVTCIACGFHAWFTPEREGR